MARHLGNTVGAMRTPGILYTKRLMERSLLPILD